MGESDRLACFGAGAAVGSFDVHTPGQVSAVGGLVVEGASAEADEADCAPSAHNADGDVHGRLDADEVEDDIGADSICELQDLIGCLGVGPDRGGTVLGGEGELLVIGVESDDAGSGDRHEDLQTHMAQAAETEDDGGRVAGEAVADGVDRMQRSQGRIGQRCSIDGVEIAEGADVVRADGDVVGHAAVDTDSR